MKKTGDIINFPDQAPYGKHRGHSATVTDHDQEYAWLTCSCGDSWFVSQDPGSLESDDS